MTRTLDSQGRRWIDGDGKRYKCPPGVLPPCCSGNYILTPCTTGLGQTMQVTGSLASAAVIRDSATLFCYSVAPGGDGSDGPVFAHTVFATCAACTGATSGCVPNTVRLSWRNVTPLRGCSDYPSGATSPSSYSGAVPATGSADLVYNPGASGFFRFYTLGTSTYYAAHGFGSITQTVNCDLPTATDVALVNWAPVVVLRATGSVCEVQDGRLEFASGLVTEATAITGQAATSPLEYPGPYSFGVWNANDVDFASTSKGANSYMAEAGEWRVDALT